MSQYNAKEARKAILHAIEKHPNTRFAKLFHDVDNTPSQKNIVLLLIELTQQKDFYVDFNVSLQYFLELYEILDAANKEFLFNEAGLLIFNAAQIYSRRLDCVEQRVEDQLATLSKGEESKQTDNSNNTDKATAEKPKRTRKRLIEATTDPYEVELETKKFKKLTPTKRFAPGTLLDKLKAYQTNLDVENYIHPALWKLAEIVDLENDEDFDSKRNYRLFTSHLEHRYNTLVPDINFGLYFRIKDYMDEEDERYDDKELGQDSQWPSGHSQAYIKRYIDLEDQALGHTPRSAKRQRMLSPIFESNDNSLDNEDLPKVDDNLENCNKDSSALEDSINNANTSQETSNDNKLISDSGLGSSLLESSLNITELTATNDLSQTSLIENITAESLPQNSTLNDGIEKSNDENETLSLSQQNDSGISLSQDDCTNITLSENDNPDLNNKILDDLCKSIEAMETEPTLDSDQLLTTSEAETANKSSEDVNIAHEESIKDKDNFTKSLEITINDNKVSSDSCAHLSPQTDEGVYFSDTDDSPLTPQPPEVEIYELPVSAQQIEWPIRYNIFEFPEKILRKMRRKILLKTLGPEMELYLKARHYKRTRFTTNETPVAQSRKLKLLYYESSDYCGYLDTPPSSPGSDEDLIGFTKEGDCVLQRCKEATNSNNFDTFLRINDKNLRLSRDSGVGNELTATPEKNTMFFPPIPEDPKNINSEDPSQQNLFNTDESSSQVVILENRLLTTGEEKEQAENSLTTEKEKEVENICDVITSEETNIQTENVEKVSEENIPENVETADDDEIGDRNELISDNINDDSNENPAQELFCNIRTLTQSPVIDTNITNDNQTELSEDIVTKIQSWHRHLQPILVHSRERHHFDVFEIGTNILNGFKQPQYNIASAKEITFQDVMQHQDPSYVSRYFLSSLLLANQGNIELSIVNKCSDKPSQWSDVHFKLISNTRHVVSMEDNIGMIPTTTTDNQTTKTATKKVPAKAPLTTTTTTPINTPTPPSRKRSFNALKVNLNKIQMVKPIGKAPRKSVDHDSGVYSNEEFDML